ncbi:uncharacterized protein LOC109711025 [Ananas comosus]|uniref:Uncharacterized protein LOC109711025 n=1 Tax=Ananas comosus TaxID=4615 RepID=A0A199W659_ANACO|nr:uncharacterized protein LOC109711025 [Ananas comosus]OAY84673.1 hypothetical protein ACMD2_07143 [Ananas comosus]
MAQSKEDIKYGAAQAKVSEDESLRVAYKHGTPLEGGKIAESKPVDLFADAGRIDSANRGGGDRDGDSDGDNSAARPGEEPGAGEEKDGAKIAD